MFARLFRRKAAPPPAEPPTTGGARVYAVGDVHGRADVLARLSQLILADAVGRAAVLVFLGDYVDRGPDSPGVIDQVLALSASSGLEVRALKGNHEQALLAFLDDAAAGPAWTRHGGAATLMAYGVRPPTDLDPEAWEAARQAFARALPARHLAFLRNLSLTTSVGDYAFVHAGVRPGVPLEAQAEQDLLWIREPFLGFAGRHEKVIVHGHTPAAEPQLNPNRLGLDTGCYATGVLTAVRLEGTDQRLIQARV